jgi:transcriptional regulator with XRE-family HTH domain
MAKVRGATARQLRERASLSQRRAAAKLAKPEESISKVQAFLQRLESRDVTEVDDEKAQALADSYGADVDELAEETLWVPFDPRRMQPREIGLQLAVYTSQERANQAREVLGQTRVAKNVSLLPLPRRAVEEAVALSLPRDVRDSALCVDRSTQDLKALVSLERYLSGTREPSREGLIEIARALLAGFNPMLMLRLQATRVAHMKSTSVAQAELEDAQRRLSRLWQLMRTYNEEQLHIAGLEHA